MKMIDKITDLKPGDHLCCLYETEEEHRAILTPFIRQGFERNEKVIYIVDTHPAETILQYLQESPDFTSRRTCKIGPYLERGQFVVLSRDATYMKDGFFDPEKMIAFLRSETDRALAKGYSALRVTGEMTWVLHGLPGSDRLIEYEALLNEFFPGSRCLAVCQYDKRSFDSELLLNVLRTHPIAIVGKEIYGNFYYIPPADLMGGELAAKELHCWEQNLAEYKQVEKELEEKVKELLYDNKLFIQRELRVKKLQDRVEELEKTDLN